jgi:hypothetical protein
METNRIRNKSSIQVMMWDKMCIHNIPWNSTTMVPYWWGMLMFGGISKYHDFFCERSIKVRYYKNNNIELWDAHITN